MKCILQNAVFGFAHHSDIISNLYKRRLKPDMDVLRVCVFNVIHTHSFWNKVIADQEASTASFRFVVLCFGFALVFMSCRLYWRMSYYLSPPVQKTAERINLQPRFGVLKCSAQISVYMRKDTSRARIWSKAVHGLEVSSGWLKPCRPQKHQVLLW